MKKRGHCIVVLLIGIALLAPANLAYATPIEFNGVSVLDYIKDGIKIVEELDKFLTILNPTPPTGLNPKVQIVFRETQSQLRIQLSGGDFETSTQQGFKFTGAYWDSTFTVNQQNKFGPEHVFVGGNILHTKGPHSDDGLGSFINFNLAFPEITGTDPVPSDLTGDVAHKTNGHLDEYELQMNGLTQENGRQIRNWQFTAEVDHVVPEPATFSLLGMGFLVLVLIFCFRKRYMQVS